MNSILCHSCFERVDNSEDKCSKCGAIIKEDDEKKIHEFIKKISELSNKSEIPMTYEYILLIMINVFISFQLLFLGIVMLLFNFQLKPYMDMEFHSWILIFLSGISFILTIGLAKRKKIVKHLIVISIPIQLVIFADVVGKFEVILDNISTINPIPKLIEFIYDWSFVFLAYIVILSTVYSLQLYFVIFNHQVNRCMKN